MRSCTTFTQMPFFLMTNSSMTHPTSWSFYLQMRPIQIVSVENGGKMIELPTFTDQVQSEFGTK